MNDASEDCVTIGDSRSGVTLSPAGSGDAYFSPTRVDIVAGPFRGSIIDEEVASYQQFYRSLGNLYRTVSGVAKLGGEYLDLELVALPLGQIEVKVRAVGCHIPRNELRFDFQIDQSYLPSIIAAVARCFLRVPSHDQQ
jgi:hypothetical protein